MIDLLNMDQYENMDSETAVILTGILNCKNFDGINEVIGRVGTHGHKLRLNNDGTVSEYDDRGALINDNLCKVKRVFKLNLDLETDDCYTMNFESLEMIIDALGPHSTQTRQIYEIYSECLHHYDNEKLQ